MPAPQPAAPRGFAAGPTPRQRATRRGFMLGSSACSRACCRRSAPARTPRSGVRTTPPTGRSRTACRTCSTATGTAQHLPARALDAQREHAADARRGGAGGAHRARRGATTARGRWSHALCNGPAWVTRPDRLARATSPGWRDGLAGGGIQHLVVDTEIAWALSVAWRAREALGLDQATADLIADRIISHRRGSFWRWPALRLNQINWYARIYAAAAAVGGAGRAAHAQLLEAAAPLRRRRAQADGGATVSQPRRRLPLPLPAAGVRAPQVQPRQRRVREHRLRLPGRLPAGARGGHAGAGLARARAVVRGVERAGAVAATGPTPAT